MRTQALINSKFMGWKTALDASRMLLHLLLRGQTNFLRMLFRFSKVYNARRFYDDHLKPVRYAMNRPVRQPQQSVAPLLRVHQK